MLSINRQAMNDLEVVDDPVADTNDDQEMEVPEVEGEKLTSSVPIEMES